MWKWTPKFRVLLPWTLQSTSAFIKMQLLSLLTEGNSLISILHCTVLHIPDFGELNPLPNFYQDSSVKSGIFFLRNYSNHNKNHMFLLYRSTFCKKPKTPMDLRVHIYSQGCKTLFLSHYKISSSTHTVHSGQYMCSSFCESTNTYFTIVFQAALEIFILLSQRVISSLWILQDIPGYKSWNAAMAPVNDVQTTG